MDACKTLVFMEYQATYTSSLRERPAGKPRRSPHAPPHPVYPRRGRQVPGEVNEDVDRIGADEAGALG